MRRPAPRGSFQKRLIIRFLSVVGMIVGAFVLFAAVGIFAFMKPAVADENTEKNQEAADFADEGQEEDKDGFLASLLLPPKKTVFLVIGTDASDMLADVIILGCFDRDTAQIDLINIPRDTYTELNDEVRQFLRDEGRYPDSFLKMTELHNLGGKDNGVYVVKRELELTLDISVDYTVRIDLDAFKKIVDAVGPITMEIPEGGLHYWDPDQDLTINIPGGVQELDGEMAEGVVRFREYRMGDLHRIEVQQQFMKELFKQTLQKDTIINNAGTLIGTFFEYVETDFGLDSLPKYLQYIPKLDSEKLTTQTMPGTPVDLWKGNKEISFYSLDLKECRKVIDSVIYSSGDPVDVVDPEHLNIQLLNGGQSVSQALLVKDVLQEGGHHVLYGGDYEGQLQERTRIMVKYEEHAAYIRELFPNPLIEEDESLPEGFDAVVITGNEDE